MMLFFSVIAFSGLRRKRIQRNEERENLILRANPDIIFQNAEEFLRDKQPQEAVGVLTRFLESEAAEFQKDTAYRLRAHAYVQLGNYEKARADERQIEDPELVSLIEKGEELTKKLENTKGDEEAMEVMAELFTVSPRSSYLFTRRAQIALDNGEFDSWAVLSKQAILLDPNNTKAYMLRANILFCKGFVDEALVSLRMHSTSADVRAQRQLMQKAIIGFRQNLSKLNSKAAKGNIEQSLEWLNSCNISCSQYCAAADPIMIDLVVAKARLLHLKNETVKAIELLTTSIELDQQRADLYAERGLLHEDLHDYVAAETDYRRAVELDPHDMNSYKALKRVQRANRQSQESLYAILGVNRTASDEEIREAYKNLTKQSHPDQFTDPQKKQEAEERMKKINMAYEILSNSTLRESYDSDDIDEDFTEFEFPIFDIFSILMNPFPQAQELDPFSFF